MSVLLIPPFCISPWYNKMASDPGKQNGIRHKYFMQNTWECLSVKLVFSIETNIITSYKYLSDLLAYLADPCSVDRKGEIARLT